MWPNLTCLLNHFELVFPFYFVHLLIFYRFIFILKVLDDEAKQHLVENIVGHLKNAQEFLQKRTVANFSQVHPDFGSRLAEGLQKAKVSDDDQSTESATVQKKNPALNKKEMTNGNPGRESPKFKLVNWDGEPV